MIVGGGTIVAVFLGFPMPRLKKALFDVIDSFRSGRKEEETARDILEITRIYRKADIRKLERRMRDLDDTFLKTGVHLLMNHKSSEEIRVILERALTSRMMDYHFSQNVLKTVSRLTPSFGLAGTVISLIKMFQNMESIETIAPHMAVAMMSTFYGVIIANLFMLPLAAKLEEHSLASEERMHRIIEGIVGMNNRDHLINIEDRLAGIHMPWETGAAASMTPAVVNKP
jgi:chemotaxis protein MotA